MRQSWVPDGLWRLTIPLAAGACNVQVSADFSQHFSMHHLRTGGPHAIMQVRSRREALTGTLTGRQALALQQPCSALVAVAYMPVTEDKLRTENNYIQNNCVLSHECLHSGVTR